MSFEKMSNWEIENRGEKRKRANILLMFVCYTYNFKILISPVNVLVYV